MDPIVYDENRPSEWIDDVVFVGDAHDAEHFIERDAKRREWTNPYNIKGVINCTSLKPYSHADEQQVENFFDGVNAKEMDIPFRIYYAFLDLKETSELTQEKYDRIVNLLNIVRGRLGNILIHCQAGGQRSPAVGLAVMLTVYRKTWFFDALYVLERSIRHPIAPTFEMLSSIAALKINGEDVDLDALKTTCDRMRYEYQKWAFNVEKREPDPRERQNDEKMRKIREHITGHE